MADVYGLVSPGGAPGVTTAAVALALTWPSAAIVAECDPGGGDILAGLLAGHVPASRGLMEHAMEAGRDTSAAAAGLAALLVALDERQTRTVLPGLTDPRRAAGLAPVWQAVAASLTVQQSDVIADCGRLDAGDEQPSAVLSAARTVALVMRATLRQVWLARPRVDMLTQLLGGTDRLVLLLTGPGTHSAGEVARALHLGVAAVLPDDPATAAVLSDGIGARRKLTSAPLIRSARMAGAALRAHPDAPASKRIATASPR
jgi:hypothetical protein